MLPMTMGLVICSHYRFISYNKHYQKNIKYSKNICKYINLLIDQITIADVQALSIVLYLFCLVYKMHVVLQDNFHFPQIHIFVTLCDVNCQYILCTICPKLFTTPFLLSINNYIVHSFLYQCQSIYSIYLSAIYV